MHLCKDCKHYQEHSGYCLRTPRVDPVTGNPKYYYARIERECETSTGYNLVGQFFSPIRTLKYTDEELDDLSTIPFGR